jgi:hypothetical protein
MSIDWRREIATLAYVKNAIFKLDTQHLWRHHLPRVAASEVEIARAERSVSGSVHEKYRAFLGYANGWPAFYQDVDLFGTEELCGGGLMPRARELLAATADDVLAVNSIAQDQLLPIAVSATDLDLFLILRHGVAGGVIWLAGGDLIERFDSFEEYFLAMIDYNRLDYERLRQSRSVQ